MIFYLKERHRGISDTIDDLTVSRPSCNHDPGWLTDPTYKHEGEPDVLKHNVLRCKVDFLRNYASSKSVVLPKLILLIAT